MYKWYQNIKLTYLSRNIIFAQVEDQDAEETSKAPGAEEPRVKDFNKLSYDYKFIEEIHKILNMYINSSSINNNLKTKIQEIVREIGIVIKGTETNMEREKQDIFFPKYSSNIATVIIPNILKRYISSLQKNKPEGITNLNEKIAKRIYYSILRETREKHDLYPGDYFSTSYTQEDPDEKYLSNPNLQERHRAEREQEELQFDNTNINEKLKKINENFEEGKISQETYGDIHEHIRNNSLLEDLRNNKNEYKELFSQEKNKENKIKNFTIFEQSKKNWQTAENNYWSKLINKSKNLLSQINQFFGNNYDPECFWWVMAAHCFPKNRVQKNINYSNKDFNEWLINFIKKNCNKGEIELHHSLVEDSAIRYYLAVKELKNLNNSTQYISELNGLLNNIWENLRNNYSITSTPLCRSHHQPEASEESKSWSMHGEQAKWGSVYDLTIPSGYSFEEIVNGAFLWWSSLFNNEELQKAYSDLFNQIKDLFPKEDKDKIKKYLNRIMAAYYYSYRIYWEIEKTVVIQRFMDLIDLLDEKQPLQKINFSSADSLIKEIRSFFKLLEKEYSITIPTVDSDLQIFNELAESLKSRIQLQKNKEIINIITDYINNKEEIIKKLESAQIKRNPSLVDIVKIMSTYFTNSDNKNTPFIAISLHRYYKNIEGILQKSRPLEAFLESSEWIDKGKTSDEGLQKLYEKVNDSSVDDSVIKDFREGRR